MKMTEQEADKWAADLVFLATHVLQDSQADDYAMNAGTSFEIMRRLADSMFTDLEALDQLCSFVHFVTDWNLEARSLSADEVRARSIALNLQNSLEFARTASPETIARMRAQIDRLRKTAIM